MHAPTLQPALPEPHAPLACPQPHVVPLSQVATPGITTATTASINATPLTLAEHLLLLAAVVMFIIYNCGILTIGILPLKPRDGTLALIAFTLAPLLLCRKYFCIPAMLLLLIPLWRLADATFLHRYDMREMGDHYASVVKMMAPVMVTALTLVVYSTRIGRRFAIYSSMGLIIVCTAADLYEWLGYAHWTSIPGRMSGFLVHPNTAPTYSMMCLTILYTLSPRFWLNMGFTVLVALSSSLSISRSCMAMFVVIAFVYVLCNLRTHYKGLILLACAVPPLFLAWVGLVESQATHGRIRKDEYTEGRFEAIYRMDVDGLKSAERGKDLQDGWEGVWRSPMWGYGPGATMGEVWQPHNQIVAIWLDIGILGLLAYATQLLWPLGVCLSKGLRSGYCLLPAFLNIPCQQWLVDMPCYWFAIAVCYAELMPRRFAISFRADE